MCIYIYIVIFSLHVHTDRHTYIFLPSCRLTVCRALRKGTCWSQDGSCKVERIEGASGTNRLAPMPSARSMETLAGAREDNSEWSQEQGRKRLVSKNPFQQPAAQTTAVEEP